MRGDRNLEKVVRKNFESHESRNTKTAMMFTIALAFLIFAGSTFKLISHLISSELESILGSDIFITSEASPFNFVNEGDIVDFIKQQNEIDNCITGYTFSTTEFTQLIK